MQSRFYRPMAVVLAGVTASYILVASPSAAQDSDVIVRGMPEGSKAETVSYRDLDLRLIAHLNILNQRVERAVRRVCDFEPRDHMSDSYKRCADSSWAGARPQMHMAYLRANRLAYAGR